MEITKELEQKIMKIYNDSFDISKCKSETPIELVIDKKKGTAKFVLKDPDIILKKGAKGVLQVGKHKYLKII